MACLTVLACAAANAQSSQVQAGQPPSPYDTHWPHFTWEVSAGGTAPNGNASNLTNPGWNFRAGAGWKFSRHVDVLAEYQLENFTWQSPPLTDGARESGNLRIWGFAVEPRWSYRVSARVRGYVETGTGFYRESTTYGTLVAGYICNPLDVCYPVGTADASQWVHGNQVGANAGFGWEYRVRPQLRWSVFTGARYEWFDTRPETAAFYPVSLGVRW